MNGRDAAGPSAPGGRSAYGRRRADPRGSGRHRERGLAGAGERHRRAGCRARRPDGQPRALPPLPAADRDRSRVRRGRAAVARRPGGAAARLPAPAAARPGRGAAVSQRVAREPVRSRCAGRCRQRRPGPGRLAHRPQHRAAARLLRRGRGWGSGRRWPSTARPSPGWSPTAPAWWSPAGTSACCCTCCTSSAWPGCCGRRSSPGRPGPWPSRRGSCSIGDHAPYGHPDPEVYAEGLGAYAHAVPFPHARRRLRLADTEHIALLAARLAALPRAPAGRRRTAGSGRRPAAAGAGRAAGGGLVSGSAAPRPASSGWPSTGCGTGCGRLTAEGLAVEDTLKRFFSRHEFPIVEGARVTFAVRDSSRGLEGVWLRHRVVGLPDDLAMRRVPDTDLWYVVVEIPADSRVEYQFERRVWTVIARGRPVQRPGQPADRPQPGRRLLGLLRPGLPGAGLDAVRPRRPARRAGRPDRAQPGPAAGQPGHGLPAGALLARRPLPAADRARRRRLPGVRGDEDGAGQPDPPPGHGRDRGGLHLSGRAADRIPQLRRPRPLDHRRAAARAGVAAVPGRAAGGPGA